MEVDKHFTVKNVIITKGDLGLQAYCLCSVLTQIDNPNMDQINTENDLSSPLFMSENHKEIGNGYFKAGKIEKALEEYSEGLTYDANSVILLSNRAMVYFK